MKKIQTTLISAFPGTGKSFFHNKGTSSIDSDSSTFDKSGFPDNYMKHIKRNIGEVDTILISSHDTVRDALVHNCLYFTLIYPDITLKQEYINRYKERGSNDNFIKLIDENWVKWITELQNQKNCKHIVLKSNQFINDVI